MLILLVGNNSLINEKSHDAIENKDDGKDGHKARPALSSWCRRAFFARTHWWTHWNFLFRERMCPKPASARSYRDP